MTSVPILDESITQGEEGHLAAHSELHKFHNLWRKSSTARWTPSEFLQRAELNGPLLLWGVTQTYGASPGVPIRIGTGATWRLNYTSPSVAGLIFDPTVTFDYSGSIFGGCYGLILSPVLRNASTFTGNLLPYNAMVRVAPTYSGHDVEVTASTVQHVSVAPAYQGIGAGTLTVSEVQDFVAGGTLNTSAQITKRVGFRFSDLSIGTYGGGGTQIVGLSVGVEIAAITSSLVALSLRSLGANVEMRHVGPVVLGADAAPTNSSVLLDLQSTTRTIRLPVMTTAQRDAMTAVPGMLIFNASTFTVQAYNGFGWTNL